MPIPRVSFASLPSTLCGCLLFLVCLLGGGCGSSETETSAPPSKTFAPEYLESGDLAEINGQGYLRVLSPPLSHLNHLPREGFPQDLELELLESFTHSLGLQLGFVPIEQYQDLIPALLEGRGDIIAANFSITPERKERIAFSVPLTTVSEHVVTRKADDTLRKPLDLNHRTLMVRKSSAFWETAQSLKSKYSGLTIKEAPDHLDTEQILERVGQGKFDTTLADSNLIKAVLQYNQNIRPAFDVVSDRPIAWGVRPQAVNLLIAINGFLNQAKLAEQRPAIAKEDLPAIQQRKVLRVLTRNNPATYFLWRGELLGFEYELARHFAQQIGVRVEMVVPPTREDLIPWLLEGKGDIIAASMSISEQRKKQGIKFSRPYLTASEIVVARSAEPEERLAQPGDLAGRTLVVRRSSAYWESLQKLKNQGIDFTLQAAPEDLETEELIDLVARGEYDLTVADSTILDIELTWRSDIQAAFPLGDPKHQGWAVRTSNPELLQAINQYLRREYRGLFYNMTLNKYFKNPRNIRQHVEYRTTRTGELSPYDELVRKHAKPHGFDWRLIVAQMYQESQFDPEARSWAGAMGLMQVLPKTAKSLGFAAIKTPEAGIEVGVKYLEWVRERFEPELPVQVRMWFTLAAYNAGHGHVLDARRLARKLGLNPNRWFGHVEKAIQLLARRKYARQARHGYCRGSEPVKYVREIKRRFEAYQLVTAL